MAETTLSLKW